MRTTQAAALQNPAARTDLPLPALALDEGALDSQGVRRFAITAQAGSSNMLGKGSVATAGYNGALLGPALRLRKGEHTRIDVTNRLGRETTAHWHGLVVPSEMDGGPHQGIAPGATWSARFVVDNDAMTGWYHPHVHGDTGAQVMKGLVGLLLVEDPAKPVQGMPATWGVDDVGLIFKDWRFTADGQIDYALTAADRDIGFHGDHLLVNGAFGPTLQVPRQWVRLRLLNACNARAVVLRLSNGVPLLQVANEGGWLQQAQSVDSVFLLPAQRAEVLVDFAALPLGSELTLMSSTPDPSQMSHAVSSGEVTAMRIKVAAASTSAVRAAPTSLPAAPAALNTDTALVRTFLLEGGMSSSNFTINGRPFNIQRIDFEARAGSTEVWRFSNETMMAHPIHIHGVRIKVLARDNATLTAADLGWRDTFTVDSMGGATVAVQMPFAATSAPLMMHCHILEHEDVGMMRQFMVV